MLVSIVPIVSKMHWDVVTPPELLTNETRYAIFVAKYGEVLKEILGSKDVPPDRLILVRLNVFPLFTINRLIWVPTFQLSRGTKSARISVSMTDNGVTIAVELATIAATVALAPATIDPSIVAAVEMIEASTVPNAPAISRTPSSYSVGPKYGPSATIVSRVRSPSWEIRSLIASV